MEYDGTSSADRKCAMRIVCTIYDLREYDITKAGMEMLHRCSFSMTKTDTRIAGTKAS